MPFCRRWDVHNQLVTASRDEFTQSDSAFFFLVSSLLLYVMEKMRKIEIAAQERRGKKFALRAFNGHLVHFCTMGSKVRISRFFLCVFLSFTLFFFFSFFPSLFLTLKRMQVMCMTSDSTAMSHEAVIELVPMLIV
jgi:hypothetical protein